MLLEPPICDFGWQAPDFILRDPAGRAYAMQDNLGEKGLLITFICNHCPYVQGIGDRLAMDARDLMDEGINVLAIMSNDYRRVPEDSPANMVKFAKRYGFPFPYLVDEDQAVGKAYGAVCTPDFFGFNKDGGLQYRGRLDDAGRNARASETRSRELVDAMRQIAQTGEGPSEQIPSMGCSIKWN